MKPEHIPDLVDLILMSREELIEQIRATRLLLALEGQAHNGDDLKISAHIARECAINAVRELLSGCWRDAMPDHPLSPSQRIARELLY